MDEPLDNVIALIFETFGEYYSSGKHLDLGGVRWVKLGHYHHAPPPYFGGREFNIFLAPTPISHKTVADTPYRCTLEFRSHKTHAGTWHHISTYFSKHTTKLGETVGPQLDAFRALTDWLNTKLQTMDTDQPPIAPAPKPVDKENP